MNNNNIIAIFYKIRIVERAHREHAMRWPAIRQASRIMDSYLLAIFGIK
jgi:hypothetical protein